MAANPEVITKHEQQVPHAPAPQRFTQPWGFSAVIQGDFVQFLGAARCHACQATELKCALQQSDHGCMACAGARRDCTFSRAVWTSGPKANFDWPTLLGREAPAIGNAPNTSANLATLAPERASHDRHVVPHPQLHPNAPPPGQGKLLARKSTAPDLDEIRMRNGVDPSRRDRLGEVSSLADRGLWRLDNSRNRKSSGPISTFSRHPPGSHGEPTRLAASTGQHVIPRPEKAEIEPFPKKESRYTITHEFPMSPSAISRRSSMRPTVPEVPSSHPVTTIANVDVEPWRKRLLTGYPLLAPFLSDRFAQQHRRRFQRLLKYKYDHARLRDEGKCPSGFYCLDESKYRRWLEARLGDDVPAPGPVSAPEPKESNPNQGGEGAENDEPRSAAHEDSASEAEEGQSAGRLPDGYPIPPSQDEYSSSEFECPLCFKMKKYLKPSEWVKHIHEDIQPYVCTFEQCPETKAFKRKADWVRHENERHRQLEWWSCSLPNCGHKCYRKDNFVQHLVREHKLPEPRASRSSAGSIRKTPEKSLGEIENEESELRKLVNESRVGTEKQPEEEPCKFCGRKYDSWKKLCLHVATHMEQISVPTWKTVMAQDVTTPVEIAPQGTSSPVKDTPMKQDEDSSGPLSQAVSSTDVEMEDATETSSDMPAKRILGEQGEQVMIDRTVKQHRTRAYRTHACHLCDKAFSTVNDLDRHKKSVHKLLPLGDRSYRCAAPGCPKGEKLWPRLDNFRQHCTRIHPGEDVDELVRKSTVAQAPSGEEREGSGPSK
ncbi:MAG: hypothetical protein Q9174_001464 [Haloplaca sp. 1 TL-2023]